MHEQEKLYGSTVENLGWNELLLKVQNGMESTRIILEPVPNYLEDAPGKSSHEVLL